MKKWERVAYRDTCGHCGTLMDRGTVVLVLSIDGVRKSKLRCADCAKADGELVPPDLPPIIERTFTAASVKPMNHLRDTGSDYTNRMLGERE